MSVRIRALLVSLAAAATVACGSGSSAPTPPSATTGSLALAITGLPTDVTPSVTVTGPAGFTQTVPTGRTITGLAAGSYTITGARAADRGIGYEAPVATVSVSAGATASGAAAYTLRILPRSTVNRTDEATAPRVKLMYLLPSDGTDRNRDTDGTIVRTISSGQRWLASQTGNRYIRYDTSDGGLDIATVRMPRTDAVYLSYGTFIRDSLEKDLKAVGWNAANVLLLGYYEGRHVDRCASAAWPPALPGNLGAIYINGAAGLSFACSNNAFASSPTQAPAYLEFAAQHELFHLMGVVSTSAPNHALQGHVGNDPTDLMYAGPLAWRPATVDVTKTNYYNATSLPAGITNFATSPYIVTM